MRVLLWCVAVLWSARVDWSLRCQWRCVYLTVAAGGSIVAVAVAQSASHNIAIALDPRACARHGIEIVRSLVVCDCDCTASGFVFGCAGLVVGG